MNQTRPLILASKSPRRSQLLSQAGFQFTIQTKEVEENYPEDLKPWQIPLYLAEKKAVAAKKFIKDKEVIIAADTIVTRGKYIYGKPKDYEDAIRILKYLSGKYHEVITGVCLYAKKKRLGFTSKSRVFMEPLSEAEMNFYVQKYQPYDKAGAYAIQEWIGLCKISKIEGTYANIMGLPIDLVYKHLQTFF